MRIIGAALLLLVACGEDAGTAAEVDPLDTSVANAWRVPCGSPAGGYTASFHKWSGWYDVCPTMPAVFSAPGAFDGADWCSLAADAPRAPAACRDMACVNTSATYTDNEMGRVEIAFDCPGGPQRYYMTVAPR